MNLSKITDYVIEYSFYLLIFFVPIIWFPVNYELFEFNKMTLTYILAIIILGAWLLKAIHKRKLYIKRTPLDIILLLFLAANILSTVFSMDWHMSLFGYYSRFNGGLFSIVTYIFLYYALVTHFDRSKLIKLLLVGFASSVIVAIYAILQHPNPLFRNPNGSFRGIDAGYWDLNSQKQSFSFLGQQNWLAAYLSIFFFIGVSFLIIHKKTWQKLVFLASLAAIFLGFTFAYSRGGTLGFVAGFLMFIILLFFRRQTIWEKIKAKIPFVNQISRVPKTSFVLPKLGINWLWLAALIVIMISVNYFFSNAFSQRGTSVEVSAPSITQLEVEGKQTAKIRFIVWRGALDIFKNNPIFGTGVETFALSYYQHRPLEHNRTSEWDFLYNKAHNEYLNYLSTTGVIGTLTYLTLITIFSILTLMWLYKEPENNNRLLMIGLFAAYISYLVQNIFGFSVVITAILFFLIPAFVFASTQKGSGKVKVLLSERFFRFTRFPLWKNTTYSLVLIMTLSLILVVANSWVADYYFAKGLKGTTGNEVYSNLQNAVRLRPDEPLFLSELAVVEADLSRKVDNEDFSKELEQNSVNNIERALAISPNNLGIWRNKLRVLFELSESNEKYLTEAVATAEKTVRLAPTDAKLHYNLSLFYLLGEEDEAIDKSNDVLLKVVDWRPNYFEARRQLAKNYITQGKRSKAKEQLEYIIKKDPDDFSSLELLESLE